jgi:hypothetical protein
LWVGGSAWESNPASPRERGATDFEDREGHRTPFASGHNCNPQSAFLDLIRAPQSEIRNDAQDLRRIPKVLQNNVRAGGSQLLD